MTFDEIAATLHEPLSRIYRRYQDAVENMRRAWTGTKSGADAPVGTSEGG